MEGDELFSMRAAFWLENFEECVALGRRSAPRGRIAAAERDLLIYRACVGAGKSRTVLTEVSEDADTPAPLRAVRWLAVHAAGGEGATASAKAGMADLLRTFQSEEAVACIAATLYLANEEPQAALSALRGHDSLEARAHSVMAMLMLQRPDLAGALVGDMNRADDEAVLTVLARGAYNMAMGGSGVKEAVLSYQDLRDRFGACVKVDNALAAALIAGKRYEEADKLLQEVLTRAPTNTTALANAATLAAHTGRLSDAVTKFLPRLRAAAPSHPLIFAMDLADSSFARIAGPATA